MDALSAGGSYTHFYALDLNDEIVANEHDGRANRDI